MRDVRTPQATCGSPRARNGGSTSTGTGRAWLHAAFALLFALLLAPAGTAVAPATAQDPSKPVAGPAGKAFAKPQGGIFGKTQKIDQAAPLYLQGDQLVYDTQGNKVVARGNVEIYFNNYILTADEVIYDQTAGTLTAAGNVMVKEPNGNVVRADRYTLSDDFRDGFVQSLSVVARDDTRIAAEQAIRRDGNVTEFTKGKFTPCKSEGGMPPLWCVGAAKIVHDTAAGTITYQDAQFELFGVPVFYLPYFEHADPSVKRKSGFLAPEFSHTYNFGTAVEIPYYWALAPNYDFLFNPMVSSRQGVLWQGEFRHRVFDGAYSIKMAGIDQECSDIRDGMIASNARLPAAQRLTPAQLEAKCQDLDGWRGSIATKGKFSLSSWWQFGWDVTIESDDTFRRFYKLDNILLTDRVNQIFLTGISERNYFGATMYQFGGLLLDDTQRSEALVHPIIDYNYVFNDPVLGGELRWDTNFLSLSRDNASNAITKGQNVTRLVSEVKWRRKFTDNIGITYTPFGEARGDLYQYKDFIDPRDGVTLVSEESFARGLVTGGATVAYPWVANTASASHVIEPIGQVIVRQKSVQQHHVPDEDARSLVFDDTNLFDTQKFSGYDRIETGTRANVGVQYTFQSHTGPYARILAGQSFHLAGQNPYATPGFDADGNREFQPFSGLETVKSDYVLGVYLAPTDMFRIISQTRLDDRDLSLRRQDLAARVVAGPLYLQGAYTFAALDPEQNTIVDQQDITGSVGLQLTDRWSVLAAMRYDLDQNMRITDSFQVRYADECFVLTASYNETFIRSTDLVPDRAFMLRFELKHLGEFKYKTDVNDFIYGEDQPVK